MIPVSRGWMRSRGIAALPGYFIADTPWAGYKSAVGTTLRSQSSALLSGGQVHNGAGAQNDDIIVDQYLATGTFKWAGISDTSTDRAIETVQFNAVSQGTIDRYSAALTRNVYSELPNLAVAAGLKPARIVAATKNASSSGFLLAPTTWAIVRTGA